MKSKREEDDDGTEWEEAPVRGTLYSLQSDYTEIWILKSLSLEYLYIWLLIVAYMFNSLTYLPFKKV